MSRHPHLRWHRHADVAELLTAARDRIAQHAQRAIADRGRFDIVLSGGSTPRPLYAELARLDTDWAHWHVYFSDERCLPRGHEQRNDTMARQVWLDRVAIPRSQVHSIPAEQGPEAAATAYREILAGVDLFDLVLLGLGEDGHTASLFPGDDRGAAPGSADVLAVRGAPKPPPERVSLSATRLSGARAVEVLAAGSGKRDAVKRLEAGADLPIAAVLPEAGVDLYLDADAAGAGGKEQR